MILDSLPEWLVDHSSCQILSHFTTIYPVMSGASDRGRAGNEHQDDCRLLQPQDKDQILIRRFLPTTVSRLSSEAMPACKKNKRSCAKKVTSIHFTKERALHPNTALSFLVASMERTDAVCVPNYAPVPNLAQSHHSLSDF